MKLARIEHGRCGEDATAFSYFMVPDGWTAEDVDRNASVAQRNYLEAVAAHVTADPEPKKIYGFDIFSDSLTLGEARRQQKEALKQHDEWLKRRSLLALSFEDFAKQEGFVSLYQGA